MNQKIFKNEFKIFRQSKGSIAVIVLIIGIVVILAVSTMAAFMIKDIRFTQIDEQKLKALNIAEAGISNMFLNIIKYNNKEIESLPTNPDTGENNYTGNVMSNGIEAGSYLVNYTKSVSGSNLMPTYTIISKGTEKSGQQRTVKVSIVIASQYDFIFSSSPLTKQFKITGGDTKIEGPLMVNGDLDLGGGASLSEGPFIINGNLTIGGTGGSGPVIGSMENPVDMFLGGEDNLNPHLYSGYAENNIYLNNFYNQKVGLAQVTIGSNYEVAIEDDLTINDNGTFEIDDNVYTNLQYGSSSLKFLSDKTLQISGNIVVGGNISIGDKKGIIQYSGIGNLISINSKEGNPSSIYLHSGLVTSNFPSNLIGLISMNDIDFDLGGPTGKGPNAEVIGICNGTIYTRNGYSVRGNLIGNQLNIGENSTIDFEPNIDPAGFPLPNYFLLSQKWEEIPNS